MLSLSEVKAQYPNLHIDGYVIVHRTMAKNIADMAKIAPRLASMSSQEISGLKDWFDFVHIMIEQHHRHEDNTEADFSFPQINQKYRINGLEELMADHHVLDALLLEAQEKLGQLATVTDSKQRSALLVRLQQILPELAQHLDDHLSREEAVILPIVNQHYSKAEQLSIAKRVEKQNIKETPKQYSAYGLPWVISGLSERERANFLRALPLPPKLLMRFSWDRKYQKFASVINN